jgi:hypothetical protein
VRQFREAYGLEKSVISERSVEANWEKHRSLSQRGWTGCACGFADHGSRWWARWASVKTGKDDLGHPARNGGERDGGLPPSMLTDDRGRPLSITEGLRSECLRLPAIAVPAELCGGTSILMDEV